MFQFVGGFTNSGKAVGFFDRHPLLWKCIDEYERNLKEFKDFKNGKTSTLPSLRSCG
jgi:hypothetical protein